jgi:hypothetical protein
MLKQLDALRMAVKKLPRTTHYDVQMESGTLESPAGFGVLEREANGTHTIVIKINGGAEDHAIGYVSLIGG